MAKYKFEIQECQSLIVEADSKEEARMKIIDKEVDSMLNTSCDDLNLDPCVSNGEIVEEYKIISKEIPKCPNCNIPLRYIPGAKNRKVLTIDGVKEWNFDDSYTCRKCDYKKPTN